MAKTHTLTALRGRPARQLPIGVHPGPGPLAGKPKMVHVATGSTRTIDEADVPGLLAHLLENGLSGDYRLEKIGGKTVRRRRAKGRRVLAGAPPAPAPSRSRSRRRRTAEPAPAE